jgi:hypothetical protein
VAVEAAPAPARWSRSYPPLALLAVAVVIAAFVLPSSLNLPQSNPSTVLEYAPVPPDDDQPPDVQGNLSSLGLGSSSTLGIGGKPPPPPPPARQTRSDRPQYKRCFQSPNGVARQSEDPMSPPCVPYFEGDNFGDTYQGVTRDEIAVLVYLDRGCPNYECAPSSGRYVDLDDPPKPVCPKTWPSDYPDHDKCDYIWIRMARAFNLFFNARFQTYNRRVHYYAYITSSTEAATRRKDAQDNWSLLHPFAVVDYATYNGHNDAYDDAMASRGVLVISRQSALEGSFFRKIAPLMWGFWPDVEHWSDQYVSYVCNRVAPHKVAHAGNPQGQGGDNGKRRNFGIWRTNDDGEPGLRKFAQLVKDKLAKQCSLTIDPNLEETFSHSGFIVDSSDPGVEAAQAVAKFKQNGVTTVLYLGGTEGRFTHEAEQAKYYPEIVFAGDLELDNNQAGRLQSQEVWQNAWGTQFMLRIDRPEDAWGYRAVKEADANRTTDEARFANEMYRDHWMLFQAIQVAGPDLTPETIDKGFHAIPTHSSTNPYIASCFFDPDDYTCVKDDMEVWWDPATPSPDGGQLGCLRMTDGGKRFRPGEWTKEDVAFRKDRAEFCSGYEGRFQARA